MKNSIILKYTLGEEHHQERIVYWILSVRPQIKGQDEKGNSQNNVTCLCRHPFCSEITPFV